MNDPGTVMTMVALAVVGNTAGAYAYRQLLRVDFLGNIIVFSRLPSLLTVFKLSRQCLSLILRYYRALLMEGHTQHRDGYLSCGQPSCTSVF